MRPRGSLQYFKSRKSYIPPPRMNDAHGAPGAQRRVTMNATPHYDARTIQHPCVWRRSMQSIPQFRFQVPGRASHPTTGTPLPSFSSFCRSPEHPLHKVPHYNFQFKPHGRSPKLPIHKAVQSSAFQNSNSNLMVGARSFRSKGRATLLLLPHILCEARA